MSSSIRKSHDESWIDGDLPEDHIYEASYDAWDSDRYDDDDDFDGDDDDMDDDFDDNDDDDDD